LVSFLQRCTLGWHLFIPPCHSNRIVLFRPIRGESISLCKSLLITVSGITTYTRRLHPLTRVSRAWFQPREILVTALGQDKFSPARILQMLLIIPGPGLATLNGKFLSGLENAILISPTSYTKSCHAIKQQPISNNICSIRMSLRGKKVATQRHAIAVIYDQGKCLVLLFSSTVRNIGDAKRWVKEHGAGIWQSICEGDREKHCISSPAAIYYAI
jgi:hypothetical protein